jgi:hypothetical protein
MVAEQWAYVVGKFEEAVQAQKNIIADRVAAGDGYSEYEDGWLKIMEVGLAKAKGSHHVNRAVSGVVSDNRLLIEFLFKLKAQVEELEPEDTSARTGMMDVLDYWIADLLDALMSDHVIFVDGMGQRWLVPKSQRLLIPFIP